MKRRFEGRQSAVAAMLSLTLFCASVGWAQKFTQLALAKKELYATLTTTKGDIVLKLFSKEAPKTVANFVGLASGEKAFTDSKTGVQVTRPYYDDTFFHRVLERFMIQGGCPVGDGSGNPGYTIADEISPTQKFDRPLLLAMANRGPDTGSAQFFITTAAAKHLNGLHTIFGEVVAGANVVTAIERGAKNPRDKSQLIAEVKVLHVTVALKAPSSAP